MQPGTCYQYQEKGTCSFGDACRFSHDGVIPLQASGRGSGFYSGYKSFGNNFGQSYGGYQQQAPTGTCYQFRDTGNCRFGPACRYSHQSGTMSFSGYSMGGGSSFSKPQNQTSMGVCFLWRDTQSCKFGSACRFSHDANPPSNNPPPRGVCRNWRDTRDCKFGSFCKYSHEDPTENKGENKSDAPINGDGTNGGLGSVTTQVQGAGPGLVIQGVGIARSIAPSTGTSVSSQTQGQGGQGQQQGGGQLGQGQQGSGQQQTQQSGQGQTVLATLSGGPGSSANQPFYDDGSLDVAEGEDS